jgi:Amt family ammonium transporter
MDESEELLWNFLVSGFAFIGLAGFSLLEAGVSQRKHGGVILMKNMLQLSIGLLLFYFLGYALTHGNVDEKFLGKDLFGGDADMENSKHYLKAAMFGLFGCMTVFTVNGPLSGRAQLYCYILSALTIMSFVYPAVGAWRWGGGWLTYWDESFRDYGGAAPIHVLGGVMGLIATRILHPRIGRFTKETVLASVGDNTYKIITRPTDFEWGRPDIAAMGGFLILIGLSFINAAISKDMVVAGRTMLNTFVAASASAFVALVIRTFKMTYIYAHMSAILFGSIAGAVSVAAGGQNFEPWAAMCIGLVAGFLYSVTAWIVYLYHLDDPLETISC